MIDRLNGEDKQTDRREIYRRPGKEGGRKEVCVDGEERRKGRCFGGYRRELPLYCTCTCAVGEWNVSEGEERPRGRKKTGGEFDEPASEADDGTCLLLGSNPVAVTQLSSRVSSSIKGGWLVDARARRGVSLLFLLLLSAPYKTLFLFFFFLPSSPIEHLSDFFLVTSSSFSWLSFFVYLVFPQLFYPPTSSFFLASSVLSRHHRLFLSVFVRLFGASVMGFSAFSSPSRTSAQHSSRLLHSMRLLARANKKKITMSKK